PASYEPVNRRAPPGSVAARTRISLAAYDTAAAPRATDPFMKVRRERSARTTLTRRATTCHTASGIAASAAPTCTSMDENGPQLSTRPVECPRPAAIESRTSMPSPIDCTGGFYSTQEWTGVRLDRLLPDIRESSIRV